MTRLSRFFTRLMHNYLPDAYIFVIVLTLVTFVAAYTLTDADFMSLIEGWGEGFKDILPFAMQMLLILVTGHALALSKPVRNLLNKIALLASSPARAVFIVSLVAAIGSWINWGFGLVVGGLLALEMARHHRAHFALLVAAAYSGFLVIGMGFSSTIGLASASAGNPSNYIEKVYGIVLPLSQTIFTWWNLVPAAFLIITIPFIMYFLHPKPKDTVTIDKESLEAGDEAVGGSSGSTEEVDENGERTFSTKIENSVVMNYIFALIGLIFLGYHFYNNGFDLDIDIVILIFLFAGILLHKTPIAYVEAMKIAIKGTSGIALQFPLYGGIQGIMGVGLATVIANFFVNISTDYTFFFLQFIAAGILNFFIPSAGGQWIAQGSIAAQAGFDFGMDPAKLAMVVSWGDQWTNMAQPFWALPILGMAGLRAKDIMGYTVMVLIWSGIVLGAMTFIISFF